MNANAIPHMMRMEAENRRREAAGATPIRLTKAWTERPVLNPVEMSIFNDYIGFAAFCGGEVDPTKALSWFEIQRVASVDRPWLGKIYGVLSQVLREEPGQQEK